MLRNIPLTIRNLCLVSFILLLQAPIYADLLDAVIDSGVSNSAAFKKLEYNRLNTALDYENQYYHLLPDITAYGGISYYESYDSPKWKLGASISKSFSDVDSTLHNLKVAKNSLLTERVSFEVAKRSYIAGIINSFSAIALELQSQQVNRSEINNRYIQLQIMQVKYNNGSEIMANINKYSNETLIKEEELEMSRVIIEKRIRDFEKTLGISIDPKKLKKFRPKIQKITTDFKTNNQEILDIELKKITISNNLLSIEKKLRESYLPKLSLSANYGYAIDSGKHTYGISADVSFSFLDVFARNNELKILSNKNEIIREEIKENSEKMQNNIELMLSKIDLLNRKIKLLKENLRIDKELQKVYEYQYRIDKISFYEFTVQQNKIYTDELAIIGAQTELYILQKRIQYGIIEI